MPGWDEASVDELLADPIVRDLMAADGVDPSELRERCSTTCSARSSATPHSGAAPPLWLGFTTRRQA